MEQIINLIWKTILTGAVVVVAFKIIDYIYKLKKLQNERKVNFQARRKRYPEEG